MAATFNIDNSSKLRIPTCFDSKLCNTYVSGATIVVETIAQYLQRVTRNIRVPGAKVIMLIPKEGYTSLGTYPIQDYGSIITNFDMVDYSFYDGVDDNNFVKVDYGYTYVAYASDDQGTDFTLINDPALSYMAILTTEARLMSPVVGDFAGLWRAGTPASSSFTPEQSFEYCVEAGVAETFVIDVYATSVCNISKAILESDGTIEACAVKINGVAVTGLEDMDVSTLNVFTATALNTLAIGDRITIVTSVTTSGTPTVIRGKLTFV